MAHPQPKNLVRFRINANGIEVWNGGKYLSANREMFDNVKGMLYHMVRFASKV